MSEHVDSFVPQNAEHVNALHLLDAQRRNRAQANATPPFSGGVCEVKRVLQRGGVLGVRKRSEYGG